MEQRDRPRRHSQDEPEEIGWFTVLAIILAAPLTVCVGIVYLLHAVELGPVVGDIVAFNSTAELRDLTQLRIPAVYVPADGGAKGALARSCVLSPSVMAASGGSLVIEAKEGARPPSYRVHWAGQHTDQGSSDCGASADLTVALSDIRVLANAAGGFGVDRKHGVF